MVSDPDPAGSAFVLPEFSQFVHGLDEDVDPIRRGVCNIPHR